MILVTAGTTMPFDELFEEVDRLIGIGFFGSEPVKCQTGQSSYIMRHAEQFKSLPSLRVLIEESSLVVTHAGATVAQLLAGGKRFVCFPNPRAAGGHQASFVAAMAEISDISWAPDVRDAARLIVERRQLGPARVHPGIPKARDVILGRLGR